METRRVAVPIYGPGFLGSWAKELEHRLNNLVGVMRVYVNPMMMKAFVKHDPARCSVELIQHTIEGSGYQVGRAEPR